MFSLSGTAIQLKQNPRDLRRWRRLWGLYLFGYSDTGLVSAFGESSCFGKVQSFDVTRIQ